MRFGAAHASYGLHVVPVDAGLAAFVGDLPSTRRAVQPPAGARLVRRSLTWAVWSLCPNAGQAQSPSTSSSARMFIAGNRNAK
jgi:hypothetical protein